MPDDASIIGCVLQHRNVSILLQSLVLNCWHDKTNLQFLQSRINTLKDKTNLQFLQSRVKTLKDKTNLQF